MIEIPEAAVLAGQISETLSGKTIQRVVAAQSPHGFAWYSGDPALYPAMLVGKRPGAALARGGMVEIQVEENVLLFTDGINLRFHTSPAEQPSKHQLLIEFSDHTALSASVAMYGGLWCFRSGTNDNPYYQVARDKPSPLSDAFTQRYFTGLFLPEEERLSLKAFLATQQRIPGLGNGVLQDILYNARLHPKRKVKSLNAQQREALCEAIVATLHEMAQGGGRDTERDLFGRPGGYRTRVSKNTVGRPCPTCGSLIVKEAYMGGSIYYCPGCQEC
jgi:formamidopyrimidine-DNA glycosylase